MLRVYYDPAHLDVCQRLTDLSLQGQLVLSGQLLLLLQLVLQMIQLLRQT